LRSPNGFAGSFGGRFDQRSWDVQRFETRAAYTSTPLSLQAKYAFIKAQPLYGFDTDRHQISLGASKQIEEFWRVYGSGTYDIKSDLMVSNAFGIGYDDECFSFALTYSQNRSLVAGTSEIERSRSIGFNLSFRTLGDIGSARGPFGE
jgi:LPS-assembly protein